MKKVKNHCFRAFLRGILSYLYIGVALGKSLKPCHNVNLLLEIALSFGTILNGGLDFHQRWLDINPFTPT